MLVLHLIGLENGAMRQSDWMRQRREFLKPKHVDVCMNEIMQE